MASHGASLLAPDELAQDLGCSVNFLAKLRMKGDGPPYCKIGKKIRYPRDGYENWLRDRTFTSTSGTRQAA
jgi:Helix-turn-helix domain